MLMETRIIIHTRLRESKQRQLTPLVNFNNRYLPIPLCNSILTFCDASSLANMAAVSQYWCDTANKENLWWPLYLNCFNNGDNSLSITTMKLKIGNFLSIEETANRNISRFAAQYPCAAYLIDNIPASVGSFLSTIPIPGIDLSFRDIAPPDVADQIHEELRNKCPRVLSKLGFYAESFRREVIKPCMQSIGIINHLFQTAPCNSPPSFSLKKLSSLYLVSFSI